MDLIPASDVQLKTWLVDLAGNIAVSDADVAMLNAQIAHLENQCERAGDSCKIVILQPRPIPE